MLLPNTSNLLAHVYPFKSASRNLWWHNFKQKKNLSPSSIQGYALIDTGASVLCVDEGVLRELGLSPFGSARVSTPNGDVEQGIYPVALSFPGTDIEAIPLARCLGANLASQHQPPLETIALIGRDTLRGCVLIYNGKDASFTFAY